MTVEGARPTLNPIAPPTIAPRMVMPAATYEALTFSLSMASTPQIQEATNAPMKTPKDAPTAIPSSIRPTRTSWALAGEGGCRDT